MISYQEYKKLAYKNTPQVYFDYLYRHISHFLSYLFVLLRITPNQIGVSSVFLSIIAAFIVGTGRPIEGFLLFMFAYLLDFCDGNVARYLIKTEGIPKVREQKGILIESLNTNLSLLAMYVSLGFYFTNIEENYYYLLFAFLVFGIKIVMRYTVRQSYDSFKDFFAKEREKTTKTFLEKYQGSLIARIKFLATKSLFSSNFYLVLYLLVFIFLFDKALYFFILYASLDILLSFMRLMRVFVRKYK